MEVDHHVIMGYSPGLGPLELATLTEVRCDTDSNVNSALSFLRSVENAGCR
jgi:hypothetical protein